MLQIKKNATLTYCKYNAQFLFRKDLKGQSHIKKTKTQSIILRSPKHFNIGKQKILNLNYKSHLFLTKINKPFQLQSLFGHPSMLYHALIKNVNITPVISIKSLKVTCKTKFKLKWLET